MENYTLKLSLLSPLLVSVIDQHQRIVLKILYSTFLMSAYMYYTLYHRSLAFSEQELDEYLKFKVQLSSLES